MVRVSAVDEDEDINGELIYSLVSGASGKFTIEGKQTNLVLLNSVTNQPAN